MTYRLKYPYRLVTLSSASSLPKKMKDQVISNGQHVELISDWNVSPDNPLWPDRVCSPGTAWFYTPLGLFPIQFTAVERAW